MDDHRVTAGNFLTERTIPQGASLVLTGVNTKGEGKLDRKKNIVVDVKRLDELALELYRYAEIQLPKPHRVHSLRTSEAPKGYFTGIGLGAESSIIYSAVQVFEYPVDNLTAVKLSGPKKDFVPWFGALPNYAAGKAPGHLFCSLHIFNEPETDPGEDHMVEEFNRGSRIVGSDLRLHASLPFPALASLPRGVQQEETGPAACHTRVRRISCR